MSKWALCIFAVAGGFFTCGFGGAFIASYFGLWDLPIAGFCAAFAVVSLAYASAPTHNNIAAIVSFAVGAVLAWYFLESSFYPESYQELAYQQTYVPLFSTLVGGFLPLAIVHVGFRAKVR